MTPRGIKAIAGGDAVNERPPIQRTKPFEKTLANLGAEDKAAVVVALQEFEKDWASGVDDGELHNRWDYKALSVPKKCRHCGIKQIKPTYATRVWMAPNPTRGDTLLLWVIRKTSPQEQQRVIEKLCRQLSKEKS